MAVFYADLLWPPTMSRLIKSFFSFLSRRQSLRHPKAVQGSSHRRLAAPLRQRAAAAATAAAGPPPPAAAQLQEGDPVGRAPELRGKAAAEQVERRGHGGQVQLRRGGGRGRGGPGRRRGDLRRGGGRRRLRRQLRLRRELVFVVLLVLFVVFGRADGGDLGGEFGRDREQCNETHPTGTYGGRR